MLVRYLFISLVVWFAVRWIKSYLGTQQAPRRPAPPPPPRSPAEPSPYDILGVSPNASASDIRTAYQNLVRQYHPDRVASMPVEFQDVAERRTKEINAAYTQLKRSGRLADL